MNKTCFGLSVAMLLALPTACGSDDGGDSGGTGGASSGGASSGGSSSGGSSSGGASGASGSGGSGTGGSGTGGSGTGGSGTGGSGTGGSGTGGSGTGGSGTGGSGTGGSGTGGSGTGGSGSGGTGGSGSVTCSDLAKSYATALAAAKTCNPFLSVLQCTKSVSDELPCPCPTFVNPSNASEMTQLTDLQTAWLKNKCNVGVMCPAVACPQPSGATCSQSGGSKAGTCKDTIN